MSSETKSEPETELQVARRVAQWIYDRRQGPVWWRWGVLSASQNVQDPSNLGLSDPVAQIVWTILEQAQLIIPNPSGTPGVPPGSYRLDLSNSGTWQDFISPPGWSKRLWRKLPTWLWIAVTFVLGLLTSKIIDRLFDP